MKIVVVGAGVGGLVAALELARRGCDVTVIEKAAVPGGKMRRVTVGGCDINCGPTVFTMRWVFDGLFRDLGLEFADHVALQPVDVIARHAWPGGATLDLFADRRRSEEAIAQFAGPDEARAYREFCRVAGRLYTTLWPTFIAAAKPNPLSLVSRIAKRDPSGLALVNPNTTLWQGLSRLFRDPRLRQLFGRYATYCGSSPFAAPAMLMLVAHVEQEGVWLIDGGMAGLARVLSDLAIDAGASFRLATRVTRIETASGRVTAVQTDAGDRIAADAVVFNADAGALAAKLFGSDAADAAGPVPSSARSLSAITFAALARPRGVPLVRHNVFFSENYPAEFEDIFLRKRVPRRPTVYVCAEDRDDTGASPDTPERLLCLVNAPATGDRPDAGFGPAEIEQCQADMQNLLADCGLTLRLTPQETAVTTPRAFEALFPGTGGALYGRNAHGWAASFQRPGAKTRIAGLYLAGGSIHPGPGVPMAALSGRLAAATLLADRASTRPFRRAAMLGGTSTR